MTYGEIIDYVEAYKKRDLKLQKEQASNLYNLASLIKIGVSSLFDKEVKYPSLKEMYPGMFDSELKEIEEKTEDKQMEIWKQNFIRFAEHHNRKRGEEN